MKKTNDRNNYDIADPHGDQQAWVRVQLSHKLADVHEEEQAWDINRAITMQDHLTPDVIDHVTRSIGQVIYEAIDYGMGLEEAVWAICGVNNEITNEKGERE